MTCGHVQQDSDDSEDDNDSRTPPVGVELCKPRGHVEFIDSALFS